VGTARTLLASWPLWAQPSNGYYTGVAPGANLIGIGTGDILFIFWALAGFDYILDHQDQYNIKVVNNSWGTSGAFDPKDPIQRSHQESHEPRHHGGLRGGKRRTRPNTLNPYSVAPWVISVAAGCKVGVTDPTNPKPTACSTTARIRSCRRTTSRGLTCSRTSPRAASLAIPCITPISRRPGVHIVSTRASTGTVLNGDDANHDVGFVRSPR